jgi:hypothetical protein
MKKLLWGFLISFSLTIYAGIPLAKNGKAKAEIIIDPKSNEVLKFAAEELQLWVKEISGAELPIVNKSGRLKNKIFLQVNPGNFQEDLKKLHDNDGYAVRSKGNNVYLFASKSKGVLNGVYKLLFKNTDIIWARPNTEFGTVFSKKSDLILEQIDYIDVPVYILRGWQMIGPSNHMPSELWQIRNSCNWSATTISNNPKYKKFGNVLEYGGGHNLVSRYITEKKFFKTHPEFFSLKDGKRIPTSRITQLCFINPEMTRAFIREIDEKIRKAPDYDTYRIMIEDNHNVCECSECLKPIKLENGKVVNKQDKAFRSTQFFLWLNKIARHMQKEYPGKKILTFAYFFTETPPLCKVEPNISISFCPIFKNSKATMESTVNTKTRNKLTGWLKITKNITLREYFGLTAPFPRPIDRIAIADWQYVNKMGIDKTYSEIYADAIGSRMNGIKTWDVNCLYFWTMTNAIWNPYQDLNKLRKEFLKRVYGEAAPEVEKFYSLLENKWFQVGGNSTWRDTALHSWKECKDVEKQCRDLLKEAAQKVSNENGRKMLSALTNTFEEQVEQVDKSRLYAVKVSGKPDFAPDFNRGEWAKASAVDQFYVRKKPHKDKTIVKMLYDNRNLYIGIKCYYKDVKNMRYRAPQPGKRIFPNGEGLEIFLAKEDAIGKAYWQVVVDPSDNRYWGGLNLGRWLSTAKVTHDGWSAMFTISWKSLKLNPAFTTKIKGAVIRQYLPPRKPGSAPAKYASLFQSSRHKPKTFFDIILKK